MAKYVSVKGWIECEYGQIKEIKKIIDDYKTRTNMGSIFNNENMKFYNKGWRYPEEIKYWKIIDSKIKEEKNILNY